MNCRTGLGKVEKCGKESICVCPLLSPFMSFIVSFIVHLLYCPSPKETKLGYSLIAVKVV
jgi:hypothetical protein